MTSEVMLSKLGMRLNRDAPESDFNNTERLSFLNDGQLYVCERLPIDMVRPIEAVSPALAVDANGGISLSALSRLTVVAESPVSTTVFYGTAGQGLSAVDDAYNGAALVNLSNGTNHIVTDYVGSSRKFTVTAEAATSPRTWASGDEFYFPNNEVTLRSILNGDRGILDIKHSSGRFCTPLDDDEWRSSIEYGTVFSDTSPRFRVEGQTLYLRPFTYGTTTGIIRYRATPDDITSSVPCALGADVQNLILDYALYVGLKTAKQYDAAGSLLRLVDGQIGEYRNRYVAPRRVIFEDPTGRSRGGWNGRTLGY
jgi:hypothetical protein